MEPYEVYWKRDEWGRDHYRVIICEDDTIKHGTRYYEGYHFKKRGRGNHKRIFMVEEATTTPTSRRYCMKNWEKVCAEHLVGPDRFLVIALIDAAKYRCQSYFWDGRPYITSERWKILKNYFVMACFRNKKMPDVGFTDNGHWLLVHRKMKYGRDYFVPEDYSE